MGRGAASEAVSADHVNSSAQDQKRTSGLATECSHGVPVSVLVITACALALQPSPAEAQQTQSQSFDALGRLVTVVTTGGANDQDARSLCYDEVGNRDKFRASIDASTANCPPPPPPPPTPPPPTPPTPPPPPSPPGNLPPVAEANSVDGNCNGWTIVNLTANDTDPEGNYPLTFVSLNHASGSDSTALKVSNSSAEINFGSFVGITEFSYLVQDSLGASSTGILWVSVASCGDGPPPP